MEQWCNGCTTPLLWGGGRMNTCKMCKAEFEEIKGKRGETKWKSATLMGVI